MLRVKVQEKVGYVRFNLGACKTDGGVFRSFNGDQEVVAGAHQDDAKDFVFDFVDHEYSILKSTRKVQENFILFQKESL